MSAPLPFTPKPSVLDRVLGRLFPTDQYGDLLEPTDRRNLERQGLLNLGAGVLAQTGPGNALSALGRSYQGLQFGDMADRAVKLKLLRKSMADEAAVQQVLAEPPRQGEDPYDRLSRLVPRILGMPGGREVAGEAASILAALKPKGTPQRDRWALKELSDGVYRVNLDTGDKYRLGPAPAHQGTLGGVLGQETRAAARNALAALNQADAVLAKDPNADILPVEAAVARGARQVPYIGSLLSGMTEPAAQKAMTPAQKEFQQAMDQFLHNYSALLPRGGRSVAILQNLRNSFAPSAGQDEPAVRAAFTRARADLRRTLTDLAAGTTSPDLPGAAAIPPADDQEDEARYSENPY